nr:HNH endonuclease [uncultured Shimia sp.]
MTKIDHSSQAHKSIAQDAYTNCLKACETFDDFLGLEIMQRADQVWWKKTYEEHPEELAQRIRKHLSAATLTDTGCLEAGPRGTTATPQRVCWRGRRQKVYQLVAWGLLGELPSKRSVVRHLCNNRLCIHPKHLKVGTQAQNLRDQRLNRSKDWPHQ